jgi:putative transcriptional regulator
VNRIKIVLEEQGRSQAWLAKQLSKSYVVVTNYCNNNKQPSITVLITIADILNIDVKDLLESTKK